MKKELDLELGDQLEMLDVSVFEEYADIKYKIKELTERAKEIEGTVYEQMTANELDKVPSAFGTFYLTRRKKWTYTDEVNNAEKALKEAKKSEETSGKATCEISESLSFRTISEKSVS